MTHWPRSWNYPEENEDDEMGSMGRQQAKAEEELMLKQDAAEEMYEALCAIYNLGANDIQLAIDLARGALAKAEGRRS